MAITNSSFNLSKPAKKMIATGANKEQRAILKKMFIHSESSYAANKNRRTRDPIAKDTGTKEE
jgi:hypothetical protein